MFLFPKCITNAGLGRWLPGLRARVVFVEDPDSDPRTHVVTESIYTSHSRRTDALLWLLQVLHSGGTLKYPYTYM